MSEGPIQLQSSKWRRGTTPIKLKRGAAVSSGNSGPTGHKTRWYMQRAFRIRLGKHGYGNLRRKLGLPT